MRKTILYFDEKVIRKELRSLPATDRAMLSRALELYASHENWGYRVKKYANHGLFMITDSGRGQGRGLFVSLDEGTVTVLKVYKKESQKADQTALEAAIQRKKQL